MKKIGVMTGGGDAPGLNAVIRMVTKKAIIDHGAEVIGCPDGFNGLIYDTCRPLGIDDVSGIGARGGTILGTTNRGNPFNFDGRDISDKVVAAAHKLGIEAMVCIGGDGTMTIAHQLGEKGMPVVGVPKTIDNDVVGTDITFGFDTAMTVAARAIDDLHTTADSHGRVLIVEVMGRHAGWIALGAGLAGGADVILIPEHAFTFEKVAEYIKDRHKRRRFTIVCVAEGAKEDGGSTIRKARGGRIGGISILVAGEIERMTGFESRAVVLGHLQRSGSPTPADRILAARYAAKAVELAADQKYGQMAAIQGNTLTSVSMTEPADKQRKIPPDHEWMRLAKSVGSTFA